MTAAAPQERAAVRLPPPLPLAARSLAERLAMADGWDTALTALPAIDATRLLYAWRGFWARPAQLAPTDDEWSIWLILSGRGWGKLLCVDTPIPTPSGWARLGDMQIGDVVFDESGRQCRITNTFDGTPDVAYRVHFSDGTWLDACSEHQWVTWTHAERKAYLRSPYEAPSRFPAEWPAWRLSRRLGANGLRADQVHPAIEMARNGSSAREVERHLGLSRAALAKHLRAGEYVERPPVIHDDAPGPQIRTTQAIVDTLTYGKRGDTNHCIPTCGPLECAAVEDVALLEPESEARAAVVRALAGADGLTIREVMDRGVRGSDTATLGVLEKMIRDGRVEAVEGTGPKGQGRRAGWGRKFRLVRDRVASSSPMSPYVLGAWLGDGHSAGAVITIGDDDAAQMLDILRAAGADLGEPRHDDRNRAALYSLGNGWAHRTLQQLGVLNDKHVPAAYLRASADQRLALLQGMMDTDGSASGHPGSGHVEFCSTNHRLADAVVELARSLGQKPVKAESRAKLNGRDCGPRWRVTWRPTIEVFRLPRKLAASRPTEAQSLRNHHRMIVRVERIDPKPMRCLTVDSPHSMFLAGEGMIPTHNTRSAAEWVRERVEDGARTIGLFGPTARDIRQTMIGEDDGSGLLGVFPPHRKPRYEPSKAQVTFHNGAVAYMYSAEEPEVRGPNLDSIWCDELAKWAYLDAIWANLEMTLRKPGRTPPRVVITTTPRPLPLLRKLRDDPDCRVTTGTTFDNRANLDRSFLRRMVQEYAGTRLGKQEIDGVVLDDNPDALFHATDIERARVQQRPQHLRRIVVAVDPAIRTNERNDETAIVVAGLGDDDEHVYILAETAGRWTPETWARQAVGMFRRFEADRIVCEQNRGGDLVASNIRSVDRTVPTKDVHATRGKATRAEPVASLYEQGRVHHVGLLSKLEEELTQWNPNVPGPSPNRLDALVWAVWELAGLGEKGSGKSDDIDAPSARGASSGRMGEQARTFSESIGEGDPFGRGSWGSGGGRW